MVPQLCSMRSRPSRSASAIQSSPAFATVIMRFGGVWTLFLMSTWVWASQASASRLVPNVLLRLLLPGRNNRPARWSW